MINELNEFMEVSREEMLEFAKMATFHLDDRLCPLSREDLRAEAGGVTDAYPCLKCENRGTSERVPLFN